MSLFVLEPESESYGSAGKASDALRRHCRTDVITVVQYVLSTEKHSPHVVDALVCAYVQFADVAEGMGIVTESDI